MTREEDDVEHEEDVGVHQIDWLIQVGFQGLRFRL
jgi:hypothetical protein